VSQADLSIASESRESAFPRILRAPLTPWYRVATAGTWLAAVWATTHWYSWQRTIDLLFGSDVVEYERVAKAMQQLDPRSQAILRARWMGDSKATLHELAAEYGVSAERIRQIEASAIAKLRKLAAPEAA